MTPSQCMIFSTRSNAVLARSYDSTEVRVSLPYSIDPCRDSITQANYARRRYLCPRLVSFPSNQPRRFYEKCRSHPGARQTTAESIESRRPFYVAQLLYNYFRRIVNRTSTAVSSYNFRSLNRRFAASFRSPITQVLCLPSSPTPGEALHQRTSRFI